MPAFITTVSAYSSLIIPTMIEINKKYPCLRYIDIIKITHLSLRHKRLSDIIKNYNIIKDGKNTITLKLNFNVTSEKQSESRIKLLVIPINFSGSVSESVSATHKIEIKISKKP